MLLAPRRGKFGLVLFFSFSTKVITARKTSRRRRPSAKAQVLGNAANPATRAAAANATAAKVAATNTAQPAEKIIVSNLPADVNEAQIKVIGHVVTRKALH